MNKKAASGYQSIPNGGIFLLIIVTLAIAFVFSTGCTTQPNVGSAPAATTPVGSSRISDIVKDPGAYDGKDLVIKGKIANECVSGCWFMLDDGTGLIYVDLAPNNFAIPQLQGQEIIVAGTIRVTHGDPTLYATRVVTPSRTYP